MSYIVTQELGLETHPKWGRVFKYIFSNGSNNLTVYKIFELREYKHQTEDNKIISNKTFQGQVSNTGVIVGEKFYYVFPWDLCVRLINRDQTLLFDKIVHTVCFGHGENDDIHRNPFTPPKDIKTINFCGPYGSIVKNYINASVLCNKLFGFWEYNQGNPRCGIYSINNMTPLDKQNLKDNRVNNDKKFNLQKFISGTSKYRDKVMNINLTKFYESDEYNNLIHISQCYKDVLFVSPRNRVFHSVTMKDMLFELVNIYTPNSITITSCRPAEGYENSNDRNDRYRWDSDYNFGPSIAEHYKVSTIGVVERALPFTSSDVTILYT